jgi:glycosyltransferase involved in cell wall biosynthesis
MISSRPLDDLSVLVTCYNKVEYVGKCFPALLELEGLGAAVIIVDDGSADGSSELLQDLHAKANSKIQIIKTVNQGAGPARRLSIEMARTDFVFFLDIDDLPFTPALQKLLLAFKSSQADIAMGNYKVMQRAESSLMPVSLTGFGQVSLSDYKNEFKEAMGWWRYIYKRDFLLQSHNKVGRAFEEFGSKKFVLDDLFWMIHLSSQDLQVLVSPASLSVYHYNLPEENAAERWASYLKQVSYLPEAASKFLKFIEVNGCDHEIKWIRKTTLADTWNHMPLLPFSSFSRSYFASFKLSSCVFGKTPTGLARASAYLCLVLLKRCVRLSRNL